MRISFCMIVRNEERNLPELLEVIRPFMDEMIIVDTGSTDDTASLVQRYGARLVQHHTSDLADARNVAIEAATGEWIVSLDADERMTIEDLGRMRHVIQPECDMYLFDIQTYFGNGLWTTISLPKLYRRHPDIRWNGSIHESLIPCAVEKKLTVEAASLISQHLENLEHDTSVAKRYRNIEAINQSIAMGINVSTLLSLLALDYYALGDVEQAYDRCHAALSFEPDHPMAIMFLGDFSLDLRQLDEAENYYNRVLSVLNTESGMNVLYVPGLIDDHRDRANTNLAKIAYIRGDLDKALQYVADSKTPRTRIHHMLNEATILKAQGHETNALQHVKEAVRDCSFLLDKRIYGPAPQASLYRWQCSLLDGYSKQRLLPPLLSQL